MSSSTYNEQRNQKTQLKSYPYFLLKGCFIQSFLCILAVHQIPEAVCKIFSGVNDVLHNGNYTKVLKKNLPYQSSVHLELLLLVL